MSPPLLAVPERVLPRPGAESGEEPEGEDSYRARFLERTGRLLDPQVLERLRAARLFIAGCGGVGGAVALTLARLGVGRFVFADPGRFDAPDVNRQWAADSATLGRNKAEVYGEWVQRINPHTRIEVHPEGVCWENVESLIQGADVAVDCLDISVDSRLRSRLFASAAARGIYSLTAPVLGFGTLIAAAAPQGPSMELFLAPLREASLTGALPAFLRRFFAPACLEAIARDLTRGRLPSLSIGSALAGALASTEVLLMLLQGLPGAWRRPVSLPEVLMMDALTANFQVASLAALLDAGASTVGRATAGAARAPLAAPRLAPAAGIADGERLRLLRSTGFNPQLLPASRIEVDLGTDSWSEIEDPLPVPETMEAPVVEGLFQEWYGYPHVLCVNRGRFAEALLAAAVVTPGSNVASNALFPSTRFHVESRGAACLDLSRARGAERDPLDSDVDLEQLQILMGRPGARPLACVWLEACANALGGAPLSLENLRAVYALCRPAGIPVVLDATRLLGNVELCRGRAEAGAKGDSRCLLREFAQHSDACAMSATKDFRVRHGGFAAVRSEELYGKLCDLLLAYGNPLSDEQRRAVGTALRGDPLTAIRQRQEQVARLRGQLLASGVPLWGAAGGHGVFIDVARLLPHLPADRHPVQALAAELYLRGGVRAGEHYYAPWQRERGLAVLRLAVPVGRYLSRELDGVAAALAAIQSHPERVAGLRKTSQPQGALGGLLARFEPASVGCDG